MLLVSKIGVIVRPEQIACTEGVGTAFAFGLTTTVAKPAMLLGHVGLDWNATVTSS